MPATRRPTTATSERDGCRMTDNAGGGLDGAATVRNLRIVQTLQHGALQIKGIRDDMGRGGPATCKDCLQVRQEADPTSDVDHLIDKAEPADTTA